jgi:Xaa-Pro aminopeptidase
MMGMRDIARPGISYHDFALKAPKLPAPFEPQRYECMVHGAGLEDEGPTIYYPGQGPNPSDSYLQENMVLCLECYVGEVGGSCGVKLEDQVLITAKGAQLLCTYPYHRGLLGY